MTTMLDWLRRPPRELPLIELGERHLPVVIRRLPQARRMTLRLAPDGSEVRISIPRWGSQTEALAFARSRAEWLTGLLARVPDVPAPGHGTQLDFRGRKLRIEHDASARRRPLVRDNCLHLGGPAENLTPRLRRWLEAEARALITDDLAHYCAAATLPVPPLALSNARRRWGSCSGRGTIRINWRLVMAPDPVRRSVVAHEVAHLVHFDHSPRFHALLGELFEGDIAEVNAWLKRHGRDLYAPFG